MSKFLSNPLLFFYKVISSLLTLLGKPLYFAIIALISVIIFIISHLPQLHHFQKLWSTKKRLLITASTIIILSAVGSFSFVSLFYDLPSPGELADRDLVASTKIYDRNGELLYSVYEDENRSIVSSSDIPQHVKLATLAAEDADFYAHKGFSIRGMSRALIKIIKERKVTGGSTITQQLIKNTLLTPEQTVSRKIREMALAILAEQMYTKDEILTMYLNEVNYGGTAYGVKEAAKTYFDKELDQLTIAEAAMLAGLIKSPTTLSPFGSNPELTIQRRNEVLDLMHENGFITETQRQKSAFEKPIYAQSKDIIKSPHFVMYVRSLLAQRYGEHVLANAGLSVTTTLDYTLQKNVESIIAKEIDSLERLHVTNAAAIVLDAHTGEILAMVGSKDYFDDTNDGNVNVVMRARQPGSSIKPINYAYALSHGMNAATIIDDVPTSFFIDDSQPLYKPVNYDGKYRGKITLRSALAESRNIPAVKVLNSYGVHNMIELGKRMGITTWNDTNRFGLSLTLGGGEVTLFDLAQAYQVFANQGEKVTSTAIKTVSNIKGKTLFEADCEQNIGCGREKILDESVAFLITDILSDNKARTPAFGSHSALVVSNHPEVAVKTGTSNDLRDNLTVGYNQDYVVAVWVGNNDNSPMSRIASGITGASPIWNKIMTNLIGDSESMAWNIPSDVAKQTVCGSNTQEWFITGTASPCIATVENTTVDKNNLPPGQLKKIEKQTIN